MPAFRTAFERPIRSPKDRLHGHQHLQFSLSSVGIAQHGLEGFDGRE